MRQRREAKNDPENAASLRKVRQYRFVERFSRKTDCFSN